jgi:hypothetical protein
LWMDFLLLRSVNRIVHFSTLHYLELNIFNVWFWSWRNWFTVSDVTWLILVDNCSPCNRRYSLISLSRLVVSWLENIAFTIVVALRSYSLLLVAPVVWLWDLILSRSARSRSRKTSWPMRLVWCWRCSLGILWPWGDCSWSSYYSSTASYAWIFGIHRSIPSRGMGGSNFHKFTVWQSSIGLWSSGPISINSWLWTGCWLSIINCSSTSCWCQLSIYISSWRLFYIWLSIHLCQSLSIWTNRSTWLNSSHGIWTLVSVTTIPNRLIYCPGWLCLTWTWQYIIIDLLLTLRRTHCSWISTSTLLSNRVLLWVILNSGLQGWPSQCWAHDMIFVGWISKLACSSVQVIWWPIPIHVIAPIVARLDSTNSIRIVCIISPVSDNRWYSSTSSAWICVVSYRQYCLWLALTILRKVFSPWRNISLLPILGAHSHVIRIDISPLFWVLWIEIWTNFV